ncbi:MAG: hypothetical protein AAB538_05695 [Patescibacteria group bacterium]
MNTRMAEAFLRLLHGVGPNIRGVYAVMCGYGYDFSEDYGLDEATWRDGAKIYAHSGGVMKPEVRKTAIRFFRDLADALETEK